MTYLLAVLTCGRPDYLKRTLATFSDFLSPRPAAVYAWDDGHRTPLEAFSAFSDVPIVVDGETARVGRCSGHAHLWEATRLPEFAHMDWVFTIEDDVVLLRPLNLFHLAEVLDAEPDLAQLALVRCPWGVEVEVGGFIPLFPDRYERRTTWVEKASYTAPARWIASSVDWTSSPALLRASLPRAVDWPGGHGCELELGPRIVEAGYATCSGYWGWGEPWCAHTGMKRVDGGFGY